MIYFHRGYKATIADWTYCHYFVHLETNEGYDDVWIGKDNLYEAIAIIDRAIDTLEAE